MPGHGAVPSPGFRRHVAALRPVRRPPGGRVVVTVLDGHDRRGDLSRARQKSVLRSTRQSLAGFLWVWVSECYIFFFELELNYYQKPSSFDFKKHHFESFFCCGKCF